MRHLVKTASVLALLAAAPAVALAQPAGSPGANTIPGPSSMPNPDMMSGPGMAGPGMSGQGMEGPGMGGPGMSRMGPNGGPGPYLAGPQGMPGPSNGGYRRSRVMRAPVNEQDHKFVDQASSAGLAEVEAGHLALERAAEPAVSEFGRWMITDHTELGDTLSHDAERAGLSVPQRLAQKDRDMLDRLRRYNGAEFDLHYVDDQVEMHKQALELFKEEAQSGANPLLRRFAHHSEWILTQHLAEAQALKSIPQSSTARAAHMASAPMAPMPDAKRAIPSLQTSPSPAVRQGIKEGEKRIEKEGK